MDGTYLIQINPSSVIPAKAGFQSLSCHSRENENPGFFKKNWIPDRGPG
jgi:hypothetical protein